MLRRAADGQRAAALLNMLRHHMGAQRAYGLGSRARGLREHHQRGREREVRRSIPRLDVGHGVQSDCLAHALAAADRLAYVRPQGQRSGDRSGRA